MCPVECLLWHCVAVKDVSLHSYKHTRTHIVVVSMYAREMWLFLVSSRGHTLRKMYSEMGFDIVQIPFPLRLTSKRSHKVLRSSSRRFFFSKFISFYCFSARFFFLATWSNWEIWNRFECSASLDTTCLIRSLSWWMRKCFGLQMACRSIDWEIPSETIKFSRKLNKMRSFLCGKKNSRFAFFLFVCKYRFHSTHIDLRTAFFWAICSDDKILINMDN